ncbi:MAG TPA: primosomal protein N', partial [Verrucomicrobiae bacterium]
VLPEVVRREKTGWRERLFVRALPVSGELPKLPKRQREIWNIIEERREVPLAELLELADTTASTVRRLEDRGLIEIAPQLSERDPYAREHILPTQPIALNPAQAKALETITKAMDAPKEHASGIPPEEPSSLVGGVAGHSGDNMVLRAGSPAARSDQHASGILPEEPSSPLGGMAGHSAENMVLRAGSPAARSFAPASRVFLLHGVTGSGKTEIYLQAIAHALEQGKGAIVLVPEISLTPQTVERFKARFSSGPLQTLVAVLHSHLSSGERHDEWHKIRQGRARIVIGARSAIFAPVEPLGLIIVDEEHEHTYKQEEAPRYNARDVAIVRGQMESAVVVLGSATPSLESYYNAKKGKYTLLELPERVDDQKMPYVRVVDMRQTARGEKGIPVFSPQLKEAITQRLERGEQTILFLNRRGYSTSLQCPLCGYVAECPNCSLSLTYHRSGQRAAGVSPEGLASLGGGTKGQPPENMVLQAGSPAARYDQRAYGILPEDHTRVVGRSEGKLILPPGSTAARLMCHLCGHVEPVPAACPNAKCRNPAIRYAGLGTQKVEDTLAKLFPDARVQRMDSDVLKRKEDYRRILGDFRAGKIDILVGTQMIAKGLHFPNVTLVGIIYADMALHQPDFRAAERTFQLLTQVSGRAGRGDVEGEVFVQAFTPFHPAIQYARRHDYAGFYEQEIEFREQLQYPPASRVALLTLKGRNEDKVKFSADYLKRELETTLADFKGLVLMGPAPAPLLRAESFYRYQLMLRTPRMAMLSRRLGALLPHLNLPDDVTLTVDVDPMSLG